LRYAPAFTSGGRVTSPVHRSIFIDGSSRQEQIVETDPGENRSPLQSDATFALNPLLVANVSAAAADEAFEKMNGGPLDPRNANQVFVRGLIVKACAKTAFTSYALTCTPTVTPE
jgi:hypothetical protein